MSDFPLGSWGLALTPIHPAMLTGARQGLRETGELIMAASKRIVPYRFGALQGSGQVSGVEEVGQTLVVTLGYGGPAVTYAIYVHENLSARHKAGTSAKYLEKPVLEMAGQLQARVSAAIRRALGA